MDTLRKPAIAPIICGVLLSILSNQVFSVTVLWDRSHTPYLANTKLVPHASGSYYDAMTDYLTPESIHIDVTNEGFTTQTLTGYDVAVISFASSAHSPYTQEEVDALVSFVNQGGGLLLMGEANPLYPLQFQNVAQQFGFSFATPSLDLLEIRTSDLADHPIFENVNELLLFNACSVNTDDPATAVGFKEVSGESLIAATVSGLGRVVAVGDSSVFLSYDGFEHFGAVDNAQFAENVFTHLADTTYIPEPATILLLGMGTLGLVRRKRA